MGAPYSAIFSEIFLQSIKFIDILHLAIKQNVLGYSCYLGDTFIVYSLMTTDVNTVLTLTLQRGVTGTARHRVNITCRGVTSTVRHAARCHSFVYILTT